MLFIIGDLISPIGNILPFWELRPYYSGSIVITQKFPTNNYMGIPNWGFDFPN